jgi:hypothetical protein
MSGKAGDNFHICGKPWRIGRVAGGLGVGAINCFA